MPHDLPKTYNPAAIEDHWATHWVTERLFHQLDAQGSTPFTILLPPPNVTGRLHMGHMFEQAETDILVRWRRMQGDPALWVPGTDHAGIATQMMVEKQLIAEKTTRQQIGRERFTERVWQWRDLYGSAILDQMKRLGASVDWSREYFTMDDKLSIAVKEAFVRLYEQGLIYRGNYIVNWDPVQQTAVSDLEVIHEDRTGKLFHIRYDLADGPLPDGTASLIIATTRPETMLGDTAVAVNPNDPRYLALHGKLLRLPLSAVAGGRDREIPILADTWANPEFGTGAVKVTPAHDPNDFAIGERHALPKLNIMDAQARIDLPGSPYHGLDRYAARERIVEDLRTLGALVDIKDHAMSIGVSQRTGAVIEPRLSTQWFLKIQPLADKAIAAVEQGHMRITPDQYRKVYLEWMANIHDWCLSRQLWWGHRIPAWHCASCTKITVAREAPATCAHCGANDLTQETDVLDTWFSSGLLPFTVFGWPAATADLAAFYPTQLLITGFDILFFWVARMIMLGTHFMLDQPLPDGSARTLAQAVPFQQVYIHALIRDADRQKMSKTKGNVIDPIQIVEKYGTDAVRFTLAAMASPGTDIAFNEARTEGYRAFANKIWNAARFIFMNVDRAAEAGLTVDPHTLASTPAPDEDAPLEARWITSRLHATIAEVNRALADYRFDEAANLVYQFFWGEFCDWYLEIVKIRLDFTNASAPSALPHAPALNDCHPERSEGSVVALASPTSPSAALTTLLSTFDSALRLLSPFMPFLTEELWHALYNGTPPAKSIALTRFPQPGPLDPAAEQSMTLLQELITTIRVARKDLAMPERQAAETRIHTSSPHFDLARTTLILQKLAYVSVVSTHPIDPALPRKATANFDVQVLFERTIDPGVEYARLTKEIDQLQKAIDNADRQLTNENFLARAPSPVIEAMRTQQAQNSALLKKKRADLEGLI
jgi:valyl-tRNA synthetase